MTSETNGIVEMTDQKKGNSNMEWTSEKRNAPFPERRTRDAIPVVVLGCKKSKGRLTLAN